MRDLFYKEIKEIKEIKAVEEVKESLTVGPPAHCFFHLTSLTSLISLYKSVGIFKSALSAPPAHKHAKLQT